MKKKNIYPVQLIKAIASSQEQGNSNEIIITASKFYKIIKALDANFNLDFAYSEFVDYSMRFYTPSVFFIDEYEIHIHKDAINSIQSDLDWYSKIYGDLKEMQIIIDLLKRIK